MSAAWLAMGAVAAANFVLKAVGPVLLGGRPLPRRLNVVVALLAPAILAALVVVGTLGGDGRLIVDQRTAGVGVAGAALVMRLPLLVAVALGALAAGLSRTLT